MKKINLILFLLVFSHSKLSFSCSYYPYGEDIRICLFDPTIVDKEMSVFYYTTYFLSDRIQHELEGPNLNLIEWYDYFEGKFSLECIDQLIYQSEFDNFDADLIKNELFQFFKSGNEPEVASYIQFAKRVEYVLRKDLWKERDFMKEDAYKCYSLAIKYADKTENELLQLRYNYQAIVLAYYLGLNADVHQRYHQKVEPLNSSSIISKWALFYEACSMDNKLERYLIFARLFEETRSKNEFIYKNFPRDRETQEEVLDYCKTDEDRANVIALTAFMNPARGLESIKKIAQLNPSNSLLEVLLVREVNKMEDWFFTDRYTGYGLGIENGWWEEKKAAFAFLDAANFEKDKVYLKEVIKFCEEYVGEVNLSNRIVWDLALAYMAYMNDDRNKTDKYTSRIAENCSDSTLLGELKSIEALAAVKFNNEWTSAFQDQLYFQLNELDQFKKYIHNYEHFKGQLMLAFSRKFLEEKNYVYAALFEGQVDGGTIEQYSDWRSVSYQPFNLLNMNANSSAMDRFFELWNKPDKTKLEQQLFEGLEPYRWRLTDLWGTTYLREDKLEKALEIYETIPDSVWEVTNRDLHYYYARELDVNPFETRFITSALDFDKDRSVIYTKPAFLRELIRLKNEVNMNPKQRAYNYMLIGNAYYNMTINGNSWYMTEYGKSSYSYEGSSGLNIDYYRGDRALYYYQLAEQSSKSLEFAAFCYRLQYKCVVLKNEYEKRKQVPREFMKRFEAKYPDFAKDLYGCDRFDYYFEKHKEA